MRSINIVLVEDDYLHEDYLKDFLRKETNGSQITTIDSESKFLEAIPRFRKNPPHLFIIDTMLRWIELMPNTPEPPEQVRRGGVRRAGFRCQAYLLKYPETKKVPVVICSSLPKEDLKDDLNKLPTHVKYSSKEDKQTLSKIIHELIF